MLLIYKPTQTFQDKETMHAFIEIYPIISLLYLNSFLLGSHVIESGVDCPLEM